jgi:hypothetical protein
MHCADLLRSSASMLGAACADQPPGIAMSQALRSRDKPLTHLLGPISTLLFGHSTLWPTQLRLACCASLPLVVQVLPATRRVCHAACTNFAALATAPSALLCHQVMLVACRCRPMCAAELSCTQRRHDGALYSMNNKQHHHQLQRPASC